MSDIKAFRSLNKQQPRQHHHEHHQHAPLQQQKRLPVLDSVLEYEKLHRIGEGTYGVVYKGILQSCELDRLTTLTSSCAAAPVLAVLHRSMLTRLCLIVAAARHIPTGQIVALKKVRLQLRVSLVVVL